MNTSNALTLRVSSKQIRLQVPPKSFGVDSWIPQMIRQWIPDCRSGNRKCTGPKGATANTWNWQLVTSGRSQMLAARNFGDWHAVVGEVLGGITSQCISCDRRQHVEHTAAWNHVVFWKRGTAETGSCGWVVCIGSLYLSLKPKFKTLVWNQMSVWNQN